MDEKVCIKCDTPKPLGEFHERSEARGGGHEGACKECRRKRNLEIYHANPEAHAHRHRRRKFGLSAAQYMDMMEAQEFQCAICLDDITNRACVDHCHTSGVVRGLLCVRCNAGIGQLRDDPEILEAAIRYLRESAHLRG